LYFCTNKKLSAWTDLPKPPSVTTQILFSVWQFWYEYKFRHPIQLGKFVL